VVLVDVPVATWVVVVVGTLGVVVVVVEIVVGRIVVVVGRIVVVVGAIVVVGAVVVVSGGRMLVVTDAVQVTNPPPPLPDPLHWLTVTGSAELTVEGVTVH